jgi:hypothetical protein
MEATMKANKTRLLLMALKLSIALPAAAEETAAKGEVDPDISQINGHPVPVGDHNQYRYSYKKVNIATNPLGLVLGNFALSASFAVHPNVALRADANIYTWLGSGHELGLGVPLYLRRVYQGPFVEPGFVVQRRDVGFFGDYSQMGPQVLLGWHWSWDSGFNLAIAGGLGRNLGGSEGGDIFPNGYLRVGYAF